MEKNSFTYEEHEIRDKLKEAHQMQNADTIELSKLMQKRQEMIREAPLKMTETHEVVAAEEAEPEVVVTKGSQQTELDAQGYAKWWQLRQSGHTYSSAAGETKLPRERCRELEAWYVKEVTKEAVEIHLLPAKVEAALVKAGRTKFMLKALEEGNVKDFAKMAGLAIKDPALAMTTASPKVVINVGDVKNLVDNAPPVEVEFSDE